MQSLAAATAISALLAGITLTPQVTGVTARLRGISVVDDQVAWASGTNGTVLRTTDAGVTWTRRPVAGADALDFRDIDAVSRDVAYVLSIGPGDASRIYKTMDGGATWALQFTNSDPKAFYDAMAFWDAARGLAVSDSVDGQFVILATADGGASWRRIPADALPPALPGEGAFAASGTNVAVRGSQLAWFATGAGRVLRTTDGGRSWSVSTTPLVTGPSAGIFSIAFRDDLHGVVVGGDYKQEAAMSANAALTSDGGATWTLTRSPRGYRSVVAVGAGGTRLVAAGPTGVDVSDDRGATWKGLTNSGFHALAFAPSGKRAWAVGESGTAARIDLP